DLHSFPTRRSSDLPPSALSTPTSGKAPNLRRTPPPPENPGPPCPSSHPNTPAREMPQPDMAASARANPHAPSAPLFAAALAESADHNSHASNPQNTFARAPS